MANTPTYSQNNVSVYLNYEKLCYTLSIISDK